MFRELFFFSTHNSWPSVILRTHFKSAHSVNNVVNSVIRIRNLLNSTQSVYPSRKGKISSLSFSLPGLYPLPHKMGQQFIYAMHWDRRTSRPTERLTISETWIPSIDKFLGIARLIFELLSCKILGRVRPSSLSLVLACMGEKERKKLSKITSVITMAAPDVLKAGSYSLLNAINRLPQIVGK